MSDAWPWGDGEGTVAQSIRARLRECCRHGLFIGSFACEIHIPGRQFALSRNQLTVGVPPLESVRPHDVKASQKDRRGSYTVLLGVWMNTSIMNGLMSINLGHLKRKWPMFYFPFK